MSADTNYQKFGDALSNLRKTHAFLLAAQRCDIKLVRNKNTEEPQEEIADLEEVAKSATVYAFNLCNEVMWKHLKKYLQAQITGDIPNSPNGIYEFAFDNEIITEDMKESLERYHGARNDSTHDYAEQKGEYALDVVADFIESATELYEMMTRQ